MTMNPLALGFYSVPEAARLIEVGSTKRIYGWLRGFKDRRSGPLIHRQFEPLNGREEISFLDLMELRLIETLREQGIKPRTIRRAIIEARKIFSSDKPFATNKILVKTNGKDIFVEEVLKSAAQEENDKRLWNLVTQQYEHYELIRRSLLAGVIFDPESHLAKTWRPRPKAFPSIIIDPRVAYGKPTTESRKPVDALYDLYKAEGDDIRATAEYFGITPEEADIGIRFQQAILQPKERLAA
jgi:hypothetical protein